MDPVRKLLKHFKDDKGISYKRMSEEIGRNHAYIQQFVERGSPRTLPEEAREKLAVFLGVETAALKLPGRTRASRGQLAPELFEVGEIPVIGEVAAGLWMEVGDRPEEPLEMLPFVPVMSPKATYALRVRGNSVDKIAPDGSYVICADIGVTGAGIENDDLVIVERLQAQGSMREVTVKRVRLKKDGLVLLPESTDPRWKPIEINSHNTSPEDVDVRVIAHVVWITRRA